MIISLRSVIVYCSIIVLAVSNFYREFVYKINFLRNLSLTVTILENFAIWNWQVK